MVYNLQVPSICQDPCLILSLSVADSHCAQMAYYMERFTSESLIASQNNYSGIISTVKRKWHQHCRPTAVLIIVYIRLIMTLCTPTFYTSNIPHARKKAHHNNNINTKCQYYFYVSLPQVILNTKYNAQETCFASQFVHFNFSMKWQSLGTNRATMNHPTNIVPMNEPPSPPKDKDKKQVY